MTSYTIGLDDTDSGRAALDWVRSLPLGTGDFVKIVTVTEFFGEASSPADRRLVEAADAMRRGHPGLHVVEISADGPTVGQLIAEAQGGHLLVIGSHRDRILQSVVTGWLPERIAVASPVPTVVVPDDWERPDDDGRGDVVVGVDTVGETGAAVLGARFAGLFGRSLLLVSARPVPVGAVVAGGRTAAVPLAQLRQEDADVLQAVIARVHARYPEVEVRAHAVDGDPIDVLAEAATDAVIVLIGREHRTAVTGALFGSVGMHLIHGSRTPVCVVPSS
ncbi:universal stress protein [Curtobacterium sp. VKM Ac-2865]|uniref:universal stress protein n=1 Tax=Curtobacterium sp. VKM Ac-2865 TaxID=2783817 RepID=UPI00188CCCBC|nr:universal stress protein [Curtobacterium sp. VKM Ac-2865]MBF4581941.1 universal stress protein [Curtobacterium sp. VKM Ac-2865]